LKILQISSAQFFGGGERHLVDLTDSLVARGHEVYVAVRPRSPIPGRLELVPPGNVLTLRLRNALDIPSANNLARFVSKVGVEIIHAHMARDYSLAAFAARNKAAKLILTRHVLFPLNPLHSRVFSRAARVIAVSQAVARQLVQQKLVLPSLVSVVPNGVDFGRLHKAQANPARNSLVQSLGFPGNCLLVGSVGELSPVKGHDTFLRAAALVSKAYPQARFLIAGGDSSPRQVTLTSLKSLITELDLNDCARLLGELEDVSTLLAALDVFVSSSQTESFGLAIVEALACGLPVVATDSEGAREIISNGETGFLEPVGQSEAIGASIMRLLGDAELRADMGKRAFADASRRFQLERMVVDTERIYEESIRMK